MSISEEKTIADGLVRRDGFAAFLRGDGFTDHEIILEFQDQLDEEVLIRLGVIRPITVEGGDE